jgi:hypothetical protein
MHESKDRNRSSLRSAENEDRGDTADSALKEKQTSPTKREREREREKRKYAQC